MDHTVLKPEEFLHGLMGVYRHLLVHGQDSEAYLEHLCFISRYVMERNFHILTYIKYDRYTGIVDRVIKGGTKFGEIDPVGGLDRLSIIPLMQVRLCMSVMGTIFLCICRRGGHLTLDSISIVNRVLEDA